jgi:hypothetical protein
MPRKGILASSDNGRGPVDPVPLTATSDSSYNFLQKMHNKKRKVNPFVAKAASLKIVTAFQRAEQGQVFYLFVFHSSRSDGGMSPHKHLTIDRITSFQNMNGIPHLDCA